MGRTVTHVLLIAIIAPASGVRQENVHGINELTDHESKTEGADDQIADLRLAPEATGQSENVGPTNGISGSQSPWLGASPGTPAMQYGERWENISGGGLLGTSPMFRQSCSVANDEKERTEQCLATVLGQSCGLFADIVCSSFLRTDCGKPIDKLNAGCLYCLAVAKDPYITKKASELHGMLSKKACRRLETNGSMRSHYDAYDGPLNFAKLAAALPGVTEQAAKDACGKESLKSVLNCDVSANPDCGFCSAQRDCELAQGLLEQTQTTNWFSSGWFGQSYCDGMKTQLDAGAIHALEHHPKTLQCYALRALVMHEIERSQNFLLNTYKETSRLLNWVCATQ